jgi:DNA polymerase-3 subunit delta'
MTAPWISRQAAALRTQPGHALLLHGPSGLGQYDLALELAYAWLCDNPGPAGACRQCRSCHAVDVRSHGDLCVLMPESVLLALGWPLGEKAQAEIDDKKRKPSKEIRVEAMREAVEFSQRTSGSGRGKVVLIYPAERMNAVTANALLKTLEEPPGSVRFVLASEAAHQLLPTIRSRCVSVAMAWPDSGDASSWLVSRGVPAALTDVVLRASGGRPDDALQLANLPGVGTAWHDLPRMLQRTEGTALSDLSATALVDVLQKVCHDLLVCAAGGAPRFFAAGDLPAVGNLHSLNRWAKDLRQARRTAEHPFNPGLMTEALLDRARNALNSRD